MVCKFKKIILSILIAFLSLIVLYNLRLEKTVDGYNPGVVLNLKSLPSVLKTIVYKQEFFIINDGFSALGLITGTFDRNNQNHVSFQLINDGKIIYSTNIKADQFKNNQLFKLKFPQQKSINKKYQLRILSEDADSNNSIAFWRFDDKSKLTSLYINDKLQAFDLRLIPIHKINGYQYLNILFSRFFINNLPSLNTNILHIMLFILLTLISYVYINIYLYFKEQWE